MKHKENLSVIVFLLFLIEHLQFIFIGFDHRISDLHGFRQTQTALTSYYFVTGGFRIDYLTPVLGAPWSIPFEFPVYQWVAAKMHTLSPLSLEVSGRVLSIACFYLALAVVFFGFKYLSLTKTQRFFILAIMLINPVLLFWSRTFMIESMAVLFSLCYVAATFKLIDTYQRKLVPDYRYLAIVVFFGCLAMLTKVTTGLPYLACSFFFLIAATLQNLKAQPLLVLLKSGAVAVLALFVVPVGIAALWTMHTDRIKNLSYLGSSLSSTGLKDWNFGTLSQKLSADVWSTIDYNTCHYLAIAVVLTVVSGIFLMRYRWQTFAFTLSGLAGPALFTNLYMVHDYYSTATMPLFSLAIAMFVLSVWEARQRIYLFVPGSVAIFFIVWTSVDSYKRKYLHVQQNEYRSWPDIGKEIGSLTSPNDVLIVTGADWSSEVPYYSERKSICIPNWVMSQMSAEGEAFYRKIEDSHVTAYLAFTNYAPVQEGSLEMSIVRHYSLSESPVRIYGGYGLLFLKKK